MKENYAFVTLLTSDSYLPGALVVANALKSHNTKAKLVVLVAHDAVSVPAVQLLFSTFDHVFFVPILKSKDFANLQLLGRPELDVTYTKFHAWGDDKMQQFSRAVFLDADTVTLRNIDEVFDYLDDDIDFAAAPDSGWPDSFNSGVFAFKPSKKTYHALMDFVAEKGSFDGGDQGVLNSFFHGWASGRPSNTPSGPMRTARLPFIFNVTPSASYSYQPAYVEYHSHVSIVHFIGATKPWTFDRFSDGGIVAKGGVHDNVLGLIQEWWKVFDNSNLYEALKIVPTLSHYHSGWGHRQSRIVHHIFEKAQYSHPNSYSQDAPTYQWNDTRPVYDVGFIAPTNTTTNNATTSTTNTTTTTITTVEEKVETETESESTTQYQVTTPPPTYQQPQAADFARYRVDWDESELYGRRHQRSKSGSISYKKLMLEDDQDLIDNYGYNHDEDDETSSNSSRVRVPLKSKSPSAAIFQRTRSTQSLQSLNLDERIERVSIAIQTEKVTDDYETGLPMMNHSYSAIDITAPEIESKKSPATSRFEPVVVIAAATLESDEEIVEVEIIENGVKVRRKIIRKKSMATPQDSPSTYSYNESSTPEESSWIDTTVRISKMVQEPVSTQQVSLSSEATNTTAATDYVTTIEETAATSVTTQAYSPNLRNSDSSVILETDSSKAKGVATQMSAITDERNAENLVYTISAPVSTVDAAEASKTTYSVEDTIATEKEATVYVSAVETNLTVAPTTTLVFSETLGSQKEGTITMSEVLEKKGDVTLVGVEVNQPTGGSDIEYEEVVGEDGVQRRIKKTTKVIGEVSEEGSKYEDVEVVDELGVKRIIRRLITITARPGVTTSTVVTEHVGMESKPSEDTELIEEVDEHGVKRLVQRKVNVTVVSGDKNLSTEVDKSGHVITKEVTRVVEEGYKPAEASYITSEYQESKDTGYEVVEEVGEDGVKRLIRREVKRIVVTGGDGDKTVSEVKTESEGTDDADVQLVEEVDENGVKRIIKKFITRVVGSTSAATTSSETEVLESGDTDIQLVEEVDSNGVKRIVRRVVRKTLVEEGSEVPTAEVTVSTAITESQVTDNSDAEFVEEVDANGVKRLVKKVIRKVVVEGEVPASTSTTVLKTSTSQEKAVEGDSDVQLVEEVDSNGVKRIVRKVIRNIVNTGEGYEVPSSVITSTSENQTSDSDVQLVEEVDADGNKKIVRRVIRKVVTSAEMEEEPSVSQITSEVTEGADSDIQLVEEVDGNGVKRIVRKIIRRVVHSSGEQAPATEVITTSTSSLQADETSDSDDVKLVEEVDENGVKRIVRKVIRRVAQFGDSEPSVVTTTSSTHKAETSDSDEQLVEEVDANGVKRIVRRIIKMTPAPTESSQATTSATVVTTSSESQPAEEEGYETSVVEDVDAEGNKIRRIIRRKIVRLAPHVEQVGGAHHHDENSEVIEEKDAEGRVIRRIIRKKVLHHEGTHTHDESQESGESDLVTETLPDGRMITRRVIRRVVHPSSEDTAKVESSSQQPVSSIEKTPEGEVETIVETGADGKKIIRRIIRRKASERALPPAQPATSSSSATSITETSTTAQASVAAPPAAAPAGPVTVVSSSSSTEKTEEGEIETITEVLSDGRRRIRKIVRKRVIKTA